MKAAEAVTQVPAGPWRFRSLGGKLSLFADYGSRRVLLATQRHEDLVTCDESGRLVPLRIDHPIANAIEAIPELLAALKAAVAAIESVDELIGIVSAGDFGTRETDARAAELEASYKLLSTELHALIAKAEGR